MPRIAPAILRAHVHDERVRLLTLDLQGSDQGIARRPPRSDLPALLQPDSESHSHRRLLCALALTSACCASVLVPSPRQRVARGKRHLNRLIELLLASLRSVLLPRAFTGAPSTVRRSLDHESINLGSHDEIVLVQPLIFFVCKALSHSPPKLISGERFRLRRVRPPFARAERRAKFLNPESVLDLTASSRTSQFGTSL